MRSIPLALLGLALAVRAPAQPAAAPDAEGAALRYFYGDYAKKNLLAAADAMPESGYAFRPVEGVRTFGELLGHVADTQYLFCSSARGEENPRPGAEGPGRASASSIEKTAKTKAEVSRALAESFSYCDGVFAALRDADLAGVRKLIGQDRSLAMVSTLAIVHLSEHYGQVTVYLRLRGVVPPSSREEPARK
jgi:uncharacterized damage-inducible protein DinB